MNSASLAFVAHAVAIAVHYVVGQYYLPDDLTLTYRAAGFGTYAAWCGAAVWVAARLRRGEGVVAGFLVACVPPAALGLGFLIRVWLGTELRRPPPPQMLANLGLLATHAAAISSLIWLTCVRRVPRRRA
jgi:hypothetical protein